MKSSLREKAVELRTKKEMSYSAIQKELQVSKSTLSYWLRDLPLPEKKILELRRKGWEKGEAARERYRNTMRAKKREIADEAYKNECKKLRNLSDEAYYIAGLMLYAAEGEKKNRYRIALSNTDPKIVAFFINWLNIFFFVPRQSMRVQLHLYENMDIKSEEVFWLERLALDRNQLYKTQVRKLRPGSFSYQGTNGHGTCLAEYSNGSRKTQIMMSIKAFMDLHA